MGKKKKNNRYGVSYSTDPDFDYDQEESNVESFPPAQQNLRVMIDRKKRKGKEVTLVVGFYGNNDDLKDLGKYLKSKCGVGGSVKDGEIIIQGSLKDRVVKLLLEKGYSKTKASGG